MFLRSWVFFLIELISFVFGDHYKGGSISWQPVNPYSLTNPITITITERHSWTYSRYPCNQSTINSLGIYNDTGSSSPPTIMCISSLSACTSSLFQNISSSLSCSDFSNMYQITSGVFYTRQNLAINSSIDIASRGTSWASETLINGWSLVSHMDLTPVSGKINSSPVTGSLPIYQTYTNVKTVIQILANDVDTEQTVRCRWSYQMTLDECGNGCFDLPNAILDPIECSITWTPVLRTADSNNGLTKSTYIVSITAEDFVNATSTTPLSSVPHQILVFVQNKPANACSSQPYISYASTRRNRACVGIPVGSSYNFRFEVTVAASCANNSIVEFVSTSPFFLTKTEVYQRINTTIWGINITWTPLLNETGLQPFCIAAVDNNGQMSDVRCVMIMIGGTISFLNDPKLVQGSASPVGTVMSTQTRFSITSTLPLKRTLLNNTLIRIYQISPPTGSNPIHTIDCKYSADVFFLNKTLIFFIKNPHWILGATYNVWLSEGVGTADMYCGFEDPGYSSNAWEFTIWNPAASSTTTPSTTTSTATTHTVTTRSIGTSTANTLYTTTGIATISTITTTSSTSSTSSTATTSTSTTATTTTTTTTTTTAYIPNAEVMYPKDMERDCVQPAAIAAAIVTAVMIPVHLYAMINLFVKTNSHFQQEILKARAERRIRMQSAIQRFETIEEEQALV